MLDIKFIRENLEIVKMAAKKKHIVVDLDRLVAVDDERRDVMQALEAKRAEQNKVSGEIVTASDESSKQQLINEMQTLKADIQSDEEKLKPIMDEWQTLMLQAPEVPEA